MRAGSFLLRQARSASFPVWDRFGELVALHVQLGQEFLECRVGRFQLDRTLQPGKSIVRLPFAQEGQAEVRVSLGQIGVQP